MYDSRTAVVSGWYIDRKINEDLWLFSQPRIIGSFSAVISTFFTLKATPYINVVWIPLVRISVSYCFSLIWRSEVSASSFSASAEALEVDFSSIRLYDRDWADVSLCVLELLLNIYREKNSISHNMP